MTGHLVRSGCDGRLIEPWFVEYCERMQEAQIRAHHAETAQRRQREDATVRALVTVAERSGNVECAAFLRRVEHRDDFPDEAARIAHDHGFSSDRLIAFRGLAQSRGVDLADVLRAALRGELRRVVELPSDRRPGDKSQD